MNYTKYKQPTVEDFRKALRDKMGSLAKVADAFHVSRGTVYNWCKNDPRFKAALKDERGQLFDECLGVGRLLALGVPAYEYRLDGNGNPIVDEKGRPIREMVGWASKPDPNMIRYFPRASKKVLPSRLGYSRRTKDNVPHAPSVPPVVRGYDASDNSYYRGSCEWQVERDF